MHNGPGHERPKGPLCPPWECFCTYRLLRCNKGAWLWDNYALHQSGILIPARSYFVTLEGFCYNYRSTRFQQITLQAGNPILRGLRTKTRHERSLFPYTKGGHPKGTPQASVLSGSYFVKHRTYFPSPPEKVSFPKLKVNIKAHVSILERN